MPDSTALLQTSLLLIDDDALSLKVVERILDGKTGGVFTARSGKEGIRIFEKHRPDIVVSDLIMPGVDGLNVARLVKDQSPETPVVLLTGHSEAGSLLSAIDIGVDKYVLKPVEPGPLLAALEGCARLVRRNKEIILKNAHIKFILDALPNFLMTVRGGKPAYINQSFLNYLGYASLADALSAGLTLEALSVPVDDAPLDEPTRTPASLLKYSEDGQEIVTCIAGYDEGRSVTREFLIRSKRMPGTDELLLSLTDITQIKENERVLSDQAATDHLTGVANRLRFTRALSSELARCLRYHQELSVLFLDLDHFKDVNDTFGHATGDRVLKETATLLVSHLRSVDLLARFGGEEFVVLTPGTDSTGGIKLAEKLRGLLASHDFGIPMSVTASFGVACYRPPEAAEAFLARADAAMYLAKKGGRNRVSLATDALSSHLAASFPGSRLAQTKD